MSQHKRNIHGMQKAIREKSELAIERVHVVIKELIQNNQMISFNGVAGLAQVSKGWLYKQAAISRQIKELRLQNKHVVRSVLRSSLTAKDSVIATLKIRLKKLELENKELRIQIEIAYGELHNRK